MNLMGITPPPQPPANLPSGATGGLHWLFSDLTAGPIVNAPLSWLPIVVIGGGLLLIILVACLASALTNSRRRRIASMAPFAEGEQVDRLARSLRNPIAWTIPMVILALIPAAISSVDAYNRTTTESDPLPAWQKTTEAWARSTYGVTAGLADLSVADDCVIASTKPCAEATVAVGGHLERIQLAYPSGVPVLVSTITKQTLPKIGGTK